MCKLKQSIEGFYTKNNFQEEIDQLLLQHGEQVIDELGAQVDRLEGQLKRKNPDLRHIDLEVL